MSIFWTEFEPKFIRDPGATVNENFRRLAEQRAWKIRGVRYRKEYTRCMRDEFIELYGHDERRLEGWRSLCADVGIEEIPDSITQCKKVSLVNLSVMKSKEYWMANCTGDH